MVNWHQYQHYKDRNPAWIKSYTRLIDGDSVEFSRLPDHQKWQMHAITLLASRHNNAIPCDPAWITERLHLRSKLDLKALEATGMIEIVEVASGVLAGCEQDAVPEKEIEKEKRQRHSADGARAPSAHVKVFEEEAQKAGIRVAIDKPDAIQLASAFKACGSEEEFRRACAGWFASDDEWVRDKWGYAGRFIGKKLQALLNNGKPAKKTTSGFSPEYEAKLAAERAEFLTRLKEGRDA